VLAHAARLVRDAKQCADYGLIGEPPKVDFAHLLDRTQHVVHKIHEKKRLRRRLEEAGVRVFDRAGDARFVDPHTLSLDGGQSVRARGSSCAPVATPAGFPSPAASML
jgi:pyruvate/2-oxoglutarate dehydrogenase complex dihydrolipoamide dehydrogenase (E3) component